jgi:DNA-binding NtrC family response regulator
MNTCGEIRIGCVAASLLFRAAEEPQPVPQPPAAVESSSGISLDDRLREFEASLIRWALEASHGNKSRAAAMLKVKRSTLGDRIRHCGLDEVAGTPEKESCSA